MSIKKSSSKSATPASKASPSSKPGVLKSLTETQKQLDTAQEEVPVEFAEPIIGEAQIESIASQPCWIKFDALKGIQADREFYAVQLKIGDLSELLTFAEKNVPQPERIQREVKGPKVKKLSAYLLANRTSHILPAVTIVIEGGFDFFEVGGRYGELCLHEGTKLFPLDGQHRLLGLNLALREDPTLADEYITATLYKIDSVIARRQAFRDINEEQTRVSTGLSKSMDHRNPGTHLVSHIIAQDHDDRISVFSQDCIEYGKPSITGKSEKIFPYKTLQEAIEFSRKHIKHSPIDDQKRVVRQYWFTISQVMKDWSQDPVIVRKETIATHSITVKAIGKLGSAFMPTTEPLGEGKLAILQKLSLIDWSKANADWLEVGGIGVLSTQGKVITSGADERIFNYLVEKLELPVTKPKTK
jgi:DNA sulfur modification protein DndB